MTSQRIGYIRVSSLDQNRSGSGKDSPGKGQRSLQGQKASSERGEEQWTTGGTRDKQEREMGNGKWEIFSQVKLMNSPPVYQVCPFLLYQS